MGELLWRLRACRASGLRRATRPRAPRHRAHCAPGAARVDTAGRRSRAPGATSVQVRPRRAEQLRDQDFRGDVEASGVRAALTPVVLVPGGSDAATAVSEPPGTSGRAVGSRVDAATLTPGSIRRRLAQDVAAFVVVRSDRRVHGGTGTRRTEHWVGHRSRKPLLRARPGSWRNADNVHYDIMAWSGGLVRSPTRRLSSSCRCARPAARVHPRRSPRATSGSGGTTPTWCCSGA